jgi:hypothetical protein
MSRSKRQYHLLPALGSLEQDRHRSRVGAGRRPERADAMPRVWQPRLACGPGIFVERSNARFRRVSPAAPRPREGPLTEPTAGAQPWPRDRVLMPQTGHFCGPVVPEGLMRVITIRAGRPGQSILQSV